MLKWYKSNKIDLERVRNREWTTIMKCNGDFGSNALGNLSEIELVVKLDEVIEWNFHKIAASA